MITPLRLTATSTTDGGPALTAVGEIDTSNVDDFVGALDDVTAANAGQVRVDFTQVNYLDSAAINALFAKSERITIVANPILLAALSVSGLTDLVHIESGEPEPGTATGG